MAVRSQPVSHSLYQAAGIEDVEDDNDAAQHNQRGMEPNTARPRGCLVAGCVYLPDPRVRVVFLGGSAQDDRILRIGSPAAIWTSHDRYQGVTWFWERYIPQCHRVRSLPANASGLVRPFGIQQLRIKSNTFRNPQVQQAWLEKRRQL